MFDAIIDVAGRSKSANRLNLSPTVAVVVTFEPKTFVNTVPTKFVPRLVLDAMFVMPIRFVYVSDCAFISETELC